MKKLISLSAILFLSLFVKAQNIPNPYASIGKKAPKMATITNGAFDEFFIKDSLVLINGDAINRKTGELVYSKEENPTEVNQIIKQQDDKFRFLSVDPLTKHFSGLTPYQYAANRPIDGIDMDGLEYVRADDVLFENQTAGSFFSYKEKVVYNGNTYVNVGQHVFINSAKTSVLMKEGLETPEGYTKVSSWAYTEVKDVMAGKPFESYANHNGDCLQAVDAQLNHKNLAKVESGMIMKIQNAKGTVNEMEAEKAIDFINKELEKGNPVVMAIDAIDVPTTKNYSSHVDHWVTVTSRYSENGKGRFGFYENGTSGPEHGRDPKLNYFEVDGKWMSGHSYMKDVAKTPRFNPVGVRGTKSNESKEEKK